MSNSYNNRFSVFVLFNLLKTNNKIEQTPLCMNDSQVFAKCVRDLYLTIHQILVTLPLGCCFKHSQHQMAQST